MCPGRMAVLGPESTARVVYVNQCPEVKSDLPAPPGLQGGAPDLQLPLNNSVLRGAIRHDVSCSGDADCPTQTH